MWVFFWRLLALFGCRENERKFEENQMKCEKGTNLIVWLKTRVFALSSLCKGGFWLRFLRKKAHTHIHTYTHINIHIHTHIHLYTYTYTYTLIHIHIYTYTYTHTHTFLVLALAPKMSKAAPNSTFKNKRFFFFFFWLLLKSLKTEESKCFILRTKTSL